jgi:N-methylhydantoinase B
LAQAAAGSERWRSEVTAKGLGGRRARHSGVNQHGWYYVAAFAGIGGSGARALGDGIDCGGALIDHNVEWFESNYPLLYLFRRQIKDGGGAGKFRGGVGGEVGIIIHDAPEHAIRGVAYGVAGLRNSGRGLFGGYPGAPSTIILAKDSRVNDLVAQQRPALDLEAIGGEQSNLPYCEFELRGGDVLLIRQGSGGGYGDPLERDPQHVANDVLAGLVSREVARDIYGVVVDGEVLDEAATVLARTRLRAARGEDLDRPAWRSAQSGGAGLAGVPADGPLEPTDHMVNENLEAVIHAGEPWTRCAKCKQLLCPAHHDWSDACHRKLLPPTRAGALMAPLEGHYVLEQLTCPSCAALMETQVVEARAKLDVDGGQVP